MAFTTHDNAPYLYRKSGGGGDKEIDKLVGGTIAWNQLADIDNTTGSHYAETWASTISKQGNALKVTTTRDSDLMGFNFVTGVQHGKNHKILVTFKCSEETFQINNVSCVLSNGWVNIGILTIGGNVFSGVINTLDNGTQGNLQRVLFRVGGQSVTGDSVVVSNIKICDLTLMFGSTIADYVYSLEQSSQGSGLAWLRSYGFFTEDYYDYNSGELKSVSNLVSHDMTGFNLWDGVWEIGAILNSTGEISPSFSDRICSTNYIPIIPNTQYYVYSGTPSLVYKRFYDANKNYLGSSYSLDTSANQAFTTPTGAYYMRFNLAPVYGTTYKNDICISFFSSRNGEYEPYTLHSYPLGDVTLRGLPKLNGNALYYDGDSYESNGTVTRKYGVVDLGTLNWNYDSSQGRFNSSSISGAKTPNYETAISAMYKVSISPLQDKQNMTLAIYNGVAYVVNTFYTNAPTFKTAMSGVYLVYELASSATETADTYTNPQWVDPNGTEKYTLSANAFPMPVGHETTYNTDMGSKTVNTQVNLSMTEPSVRQIYAKEGDTARVLNIHLDQTEEDGTLRILRPDGTEVTADAVLVPEFYDGLMAEIPSDATSVVGKCYCDVEQNGVSSMPFTLNIKKNERQ